eukprot:GILK01009987.1.p1 GENE.GILK01009987.1~~GILK01009987.1.p1  ORF type:complete len:1224 (+),score=348.36 GILK01009987.1:392-3673(+)
MANWSRKRSLFAKDQPLVTALFTPTGQGIVTVFEDNSILIWSIDSLTLDRQFTMPLNESPVRILCADVSPDGRYLATGGKSNEIYIWDLNLICLVEVIRLPESMMGLTQLSFLSGDSGSVRRLCFLGDDGRLCVIHINKRRVLLTIECEHRAILSFHIDSRAKYLTAAVSDGTIRIFDLDVALCTEERLAQSRILLGVPEELAFITLKGRMGSGIDSPIQDEATRQIRAAAAGVPQETTTTTYTTQKAKAVSTKPKSETVTGKAAKKVGATQTMPTAKPKKQQADVSDVPNSFEPLYRSAKLDPFAAQLNKEKLQSMLSTYGQYPDKYRLLIWRFLLELPHNEEAFNNLSAKGIHPAFEDLPKRYPLQNRRLSQRLQKTLSQLAFWSPIFSDVPYMPALVFPFIKLFGADELSCFEVLVSVLLHWCQRWFEFFPNPPLTVLHWIESLLQYHDPQLLNHFERIGATSQTYAWTMLQTMFTEVLTKQEWLSLMDHLVTSSAEPFQLLFAVIGYLRYFRSAILQCSKVEEIELFVRRQNALNLQHILRSINDLRTKTPASMIPVYEQNLPLSHPQYPLFNGYPKFVVDYQIKERDRIVEEERSLHRKKELLNDLHEKAKELANQEEAFKLQQEQILMAEQQRREKANAEEQARLKERARIDQMARQRRLEQISKMEDSVKASLERQTKLREAELSRLQDELDRRKAVEDYEVSARLEEEALLNLEFQASQRLQELAEIREREDNARHLRMELSAKDREAELKTKLVNESWTTEDEERKLRQQLARQNRERIASLNRDLQERRQAEMQYRLKELEKVTKVSVVERERRLRHTAEDVETQQQEQLEQFKKTEDMLLREEERQLRLLTVEESTKRQKRQEERLAIVERERRRQALELEKQSERVRELNRLQSRRDYEERLLGIREEEAKQIVEEERQLQTLLLTIEDDRRKQRELEQELMQKEAELQEKAAFQRVLLESQDAVIAEERQKFALLREDLRRQYTQTQEQEEQQRRQHIDSLIHKREAELRERADELRRHINAEQMNRVQEEEEAEGIPSSSSRGGHASASESEHERFVTEDAEDVIRRHRATRSVLTSDT